jgi:ribosome maturation factor RimP
MSFVPMEETVTALQTEIEARLAGVEPDVEVLLAEIVSGQALRLFIDHPDGVSLDLCERVSRQLTDYRERYALEVSSPGQDRPLTKPQHYTRFLGRRARVRLRDARRDDAGAAHSGEAGCRELDDVGATRSSEAGSRAGGRPARRPAGHKQPAPSSKTLVGELVGASDRDVTIAAHDGVVTIPYAQIVRSNLVPGD